MLLTRSRPADASKLLASAAREFGEHFGVLSGTVCKLLQQRLNCLENGDSVANISFRTKDTVLNKRAVAVTPEKVMAIP